MWYVDIYCIIPYAGVPEFLQNETIISVVNTTISSISIQWQPAITFPIVPVSKYIISLYSDTGLQNTFEFFANVTMFNFTFTELEASTNYHISIVAINSIGASKPTANFTVNTQSLSMYICMYIWLYVVSYIYDMHKIT